LFAEKIVSIKAVNKKTTLKKECVLTRNFYFKANIPYPYGFYCFQKIFVSREQLSCSRERIKTDKNGTFLTGVDQFSDICSNGVDIAHRNETERFTKLNRCKFSGVDIRL